MGRHDIRLRRHRMTSRRIEGYKDYSALMDQHRSSRLKRLIKMIFLLLFFIALSLFTYYVVTKVEDKKQDASTEEAMTTSRPGVLNIDQILNTENYGKT